jgi:hypothetical protein
LDWTGAGLQAAEKQKLAATTTVRRTALLRRPGMIECVIIERPPINSISLINKRESGLSSIDNIVSRYGPYWEARVIASPSPLDDTQARRRNRLGAGWGERATAVPVFITNPSWVSARRRKLRSSFLIERM